MLAALVLGKMLEVARAVIVTDSSRAGIESSNFIRYRVDFGAQASWETRTVKLWYAVPTAGEYLAA